MHSAVKNALLAAALMLSGLGSGLAANKKILLIAGRPSHGPGDHEFRAGSLLLQKCLNKIKGIKAEVHDFGCPKDDAAFEGIDAVLIYADGGGGHRRGHQQRSFEQQHGAGHQAGDGPPECAVSAAVELQHGQPKQSHG